MLKQQSALPVRVLALVAACGLLFASCGEEPPPVPTPAPVPTPIGHDAPVATPAPASATTKALPSGVTCTRFDTSAKFKNGQLHVELSTDLPPDVEVNLLVSRAYTEKGSPTEYAVDYIDDTSVVSDWANGRDFEVSNADAMRTYRAKQEELAKAGLAEPLDRFDKSIEVWILIRLHAPKTSGSCKADKRGLIEKTWKFKYPIDA